MSNKIKVGITQGDINGISYEIIIKTLSDKRILDFCVPIIYGSSKVAAYYKKALKLETFKLNSIPSAQEANSKTNNIIECLDDEDLKVDLGQSTNIAGKASFAALERATEDLKNKHIDVLLTAPINKDNIQSDGFQFPGHTEYLKEKFESEQALMFLVSDHIKVGVVTGHIPLKDVASSINKKDILKKLKTMHRSLIEDFGIRKPKIAVLGLNPHAGDNGLIGKEEEEVIMPAIKEAKNQNILAYGPFPADGLFGSDNLHYYDAVLAMYHDQGLAPFKAFAFESGVNFTAGLPIVRTSPAHGTAYSLAGQNKASESSFRNALYLAIDVFRKRSEFKDLMDNSLDK